MGAVRLFAYMAGPWRHIADKEKLVRRTKLAAVAGMGAAALLLAGCGGAQDLLDQAGDTLDEMEEAQREADREASGGDTESDDSGDAIAIEDRTVDASVHYLGLEYTVGEMTAAESTDRLHQNGVELSFEVTVVNPRGDTATPSPQVRLQWDEPGTGNVLEVSGRGEFRQVAANASAPGTIIVAIPEQDLSNFDVDSARLVLGHPGRSAPQVPLGPNAELIDRFPVPQPGLEGTTVENEGVTMTIERADIRWNYGNTHVDDGLVLLDLVYTWQNNSGYQACHHRGTGNNFSLLGSGSNNYVDESVSIRCVGNGATEQAATGFVLDADYAGEYTFRWDLRFMGSDYTDEVTVQLQEGAGVPDSAR